MTSFPCTGCSLCCKSVGKWVSIAKSIPEEQRSPEINEIALFPIAINSDGSCSQLDKNNGCKIYSTRPDICSIETMWEKYHTHEKSRSDYFTAASIVCNSMMDAERLPEEFRISL